MPALLALLILLLQVALAGPTWQEAPESAERPPIAEPRGGWWSESGLYVTVHGAPEDSRTVRRLADHAAVALPRLSALLGIAPGADIDVYVASSAAQFQDIQPGETPDYADGTAWPKWGLVFLRSPALRPGTAEPLEQVLDHELVHVLVGQAFWPRTPPRWLQEGLAQYWAGELTPSVAERLSRVVFGRERLFSLNQLSSSFYGDPIRAAQGYAAAADFVGFLSGRYGVPALRSLIAEMAGGAGFPDALYVATGEELSVVEAAWRGRWMDASALQGALASPDLLWGLAGVLAVVGALRVRARTRLRLARWEQEERWASFAHPDGLPN